MREGADPLPLLKKMLEKTTRKNTIAHNKKRTESADYSSIGNGFFLWFVARRRLQKKGEEQGRSTPTRRARAHGPWIRPERSKGQTKKERRQVKKARATYTHIEINRNRGGRRL